MGVSLQPIPAQAGGADGSVHAGTAGSCPVPPCAPGEVPGDDGTAGRVLTFVTVKRINPRFRKTYGHWWVELDGAESYGWWPSRCPVGWRGLFLGLQGVLNGGGAVDGGTATRDPYHGECADHTFHPRLGRDRDDETVRREIRDFAAGYEDVWRWQWWWSSAPTRNCRSFQDDMFTHVGLVEGPENLYTRGPGCPFMFPMRKAGWALGDAAGAVRARATGLLRLGRAGVPGVAGPAAAARGTRRRRLLKGTLALPGRGPGHDDRAGLRVRGRRGRRSGP